MYRIKYVRAMPLMYLLSLSPGAVFIALRVIPQFGSLRVYCWHTLGGYWGGVSVESEEMAGLSASQVCSA